MALFVRSEKNTHTLVVIFYDILCFIKVMALHVRSKKKLHALW